MSEQPHKKIFILGDTFDTNKPTLDEISLFYEGMALLKDKEVILIDGNHESISDDVTVFDKIPQVGYRYIKNDIIKIEGIRIYLLSWSKLSRLSRMVDSGLTSLPKALFTHVRCTIPPHIKEEVPLKKVSEAFNMVVAGDIHITGHKPFDNFHYTGQPYSTHYKSKGLQSVLEVTFDKRGVTAEPIYTNFPNKIMYKVHASEVSKLNNVDLFKLKVTGSISELAELPDSNNIIYEKTVSAFDMTKVDDLMVTGKIDIKSDILTMLTDMEVSDSSITFGDSFISDSLKGT